MGAFINITGHKFNRLLVLYKTDKKQGNDWIWHCKCDCGNECEVTGASLRSGRTKSCGCLKKESDKASKPHLIDLTGQKFGHLTVLHQVAPDKTGHTRWECICDCGNPNHLIVFGDNLRRNHTTSCGCDRRSQGEQKIIQLLYQHNISFITEYKPFKFATGAYARFDFYINNKYIIEYDGETHYQYNLHGWHNQTQLQAQQERDVIKNQWCIDNNIPLIRIPYIKLGTLNLQDLML